MSNAININENEQEQKTPKTVPLNKKKIILKKVSKPKQKLIIEDEFTKVEGSSNTECGVKNNKIYIPLCRMGCIGKGGLLLFPENHVSHYHDIPDKMDLNWFESIAARKKTYYPFADYHGHSFQNNIIRPNLDKIGNDLGGISDKVKERIGKDCYIFLNSWFKKDCVSDKYSLPCKDSFLLDEVEY
jgi:hypothetical protein